MKVRYISGNSAGEIVEMGPEAAILISNHIVEVVPDDPAPVESEAPPVEDAVVVDAPIADAPVPDAPAADLGVPAKKPSKPRATKTPAPKTPAKPSRRKRR